ncbi:bifunctional heptose 7-phosphate kinase/heptose 1-phosphate adenyltransferase [candidate division CSSED10-310 bacterium]|uniref:Bifunctional heptose 7-phosphate kinase/heptose 1-phosphate adenyltransferase n=1 Tax=candidate division CSSED10-310 bacterium TaxID=2855610 RepID=A0ABV6Z5W7_UNCC1
MKNLQKIVKNFSKVRILVIGDLMADKYVWGDGLRLSREAPINVVTVVEETFSLGGAANIARNAKHLGGEVYLVGLVGFDDAAQSFRRAIANSGIDTGGIFPTSERPTTLKVRIMSTEYNLQLMRIDYETTKPLTRDEKASLLKYITSYMEDIDVIVIADYEKGVFSDQGMIDTLIQMAQKHNVITVVDSKPGHYGMFKDTTLIVSNYRGARDFVYFKGNKSAYQLEEIGKNMLNILKCNALLLIQDGKGLFLFTPDAEMQSFKGISQEVFDLTGIEDTVVSTLALSLAAGATIREAAEVASLTYKIVGSKKGSSVVSVRELLTFQEV